MLGATLSYYDHRTVLEGSAGLSIGGQLGAALREGRKAETSPEQHDLRGLKTLPTMGMNERGVAFVSKKVSGIVQCAEAKSGTYRRKGAHLSTLPANALAIGSALKYCLEAIKHHGALCDESIEFAASMFRDQETVI